MVISWTYANRWDWEISAQTRISKNSTTVEIYYSRILLLKGLLIRQKSTFKSIVSRIRIAFENGFAGQHNYFNFLRFESALKLGAQNVAHMYMCATFFMNVRSTYYGNQFSEATGSDYDNRRILGVVINMKVCAPQRRAHFYLCMRGPARTRQYPCDR